MLRLRVPRAFTTDDVERLATLARLELTDQEKQLFARQLAAFLAYAEQVQEVDTHGVAPMSHPVGTAGVLREDLPRRSLTTHEALAQAPEADPENGLFKVPRVLGS